MKVLVTGGAGFIGSHMVRRLLDEGCDVLNVDKLTYAGSLENLGEHAKHPKHDFAQKDICDDKAMRKLIADFKPEAIIHMAAESHVDRSIDGPDIFIQTNIVGTHVMVQAAHEYWQQLSQKTKENFRFIHLSTDEVFGALDDNGHFTEESPYRPNSPYAASKASSDLLVRSYHKTYAFPAIIVNCSNNYGPNQYPEKLIPLMLLNALEGKNLPVYGKGQQIRDWLYVEDHIEALWVILKKGTAGESYCVGGGNEIRNIDLVNLLCGILAKKQPRAGGAYKDLITFVPDRPGHDYRYAIDIGKMRKDLGWQPSVTFEQGLEKTISWYLAEKERLAQIPARERKGKVKTA
jgi:dTDP-glucose 4,6-dehydratase